MADRVQPGIEICRRYRESRSGRLTFGKLLLLSAIRHSFHFDKHSQLIKIGE
jgi:hypothetical protein